MDVPVEDIDDVLDALPVPVLVLVLPAVAIDEVEPVLEVDCVVEPKVRVGVELIPVVPISVADGYPCQISLALSSSGTPRMIVMIEPLGLQLLLGGLVCAVLRNVTPTHWRLSVFKLRNEQWLIQSVKLVAMTGGRPVSAKSVEHSIS